MLFITKNINKKHTAAAAITTTTRTIDDTVTIVTINDEQVTNRLFCELSLYEAIIVPPFPLPSLF